MRHPLEIECVEHTVSDHRLFESGQRVHRFTFRCSKWPGDKVHSIKYEPSDIGIDPNTVLPSIGRAAEMEAERLFERRDRYPWPARKAKRKYSASRVSNRRRKHR